MKFTLSRRRVAVAACLLAACQPPEPPAPPREPTRDVDFHVSTMASTVDRRFLVELRSLTQRELCMSADDWPTEDGELGRNRSPDAGNEVRRIGARESLVAFVRFDQFPAEQVESDGARQVDIVPGVFFCGSVAPQ